MANISVRKTTYVDGEENMVELYADNASTIEAQRNLITLYNGKIIRAVPGSVCLTAKGEVLTLQFNNYWKAL